MNQDDFSAIFGVGDPVAVQAAVIRPPGVYQETSQFFLENTENQQIDYDNDPEQKAVTGIRSVVAPAPEKGMDNRSYKNERQGDIVYKTLLEGQSVSSSFANREVVTPGEKKYILRKVQIDKFTWKAKRVLLTPTMCTKCSYDVATVNGYKGGFFTVPERFRDGMLEALKMHVEQVHTAADDLIISERDMPQFWLGSGTQQF